MWEYHAGRLLDGLVNFMSDFLPGKQALEALWYRRLTDAKVRLEFAHQYKREIEGDFKAGSIPGSDGHLSFERALRAEYIVLADYSRVLRIFNDLVVHGKAPSEVDWPGDKAAGDGSAKQ